MSTKAGTLTKKAQKAAEVAESTKWLLETLETSTPKGEIKCRVDTVARSGMSRTIDFYAIVGGDMVCINYHIATVLDYKRNGRGALKVSGCGMDMGFAVVNNLSVQLYCKDGKYDHDGAYKLRVCWF